MVTPSAKAASNGAVSFFIDRYVMARVAKASYGVICSRLFQGDKPDHIKRRSKVFVSTSGYGYIPDTFSSILKRVSIPSLMFLRVITEHF